MSLKLPVTSIILKEYYQANNKTLSKTLKLNNVLIDSGTSHCLLSDKVLINSPFSPITLESKLSINNALNQRSGDVISTKLTVNILLVQDNIELISKDMYICSGLGFDAILGMDVINNLSIKFSSPTVITCNNLRVAENESRVISCNNHK